MPLRYNIIIIMVECYNNNQQYVFAVYSSQQIKIHNNYVDIAMDFSMHCNRVGQLVDPYHTHIGVLVGEYINSIRSLDAHTLAPHTTRTRRNKTLEFHLGILNGVISVFFSFLLA